MDSQDSNQNDNLSLTIVLDCRDSFNFNEIMTKEFQEWAENMQIAIKILHNSEVNLFKLLPNYLIPISEFHEDIASLFF